MNKSIFKKLLITELVLIIITIWKTIFYPYSLAPEDLKNAMIMYDELAPLPDNFATIMIFIMLILNLNLFFRSKSDSHLEKHINILTATKREKKRDKRHVKTHPHSSDFQFEALCFEETRFPFLLVRLSPTKSF